MKYDPNDPWRTVTDRGDKARPADDNHAGHRYCGGCGALDTTDRLYGSVTHAPGCRYLRNDK